MLFPFPRGLPWFPFASGPSLFRLSNLMNPLYRYMRVLWPEYALETRVTVARTAQPGIQHKSGPTGAASL
jgi:hypothetical protein